ncbi:right-handed parallel beta-helix repeat-containing protein [Chiayiivirga flava]|uniref:Putative outer membrane repeat protein n=1 Tax=Chiayiivirga flava TaxID=659595 RepID=A0A7W8D6T4_9GAMM|nr:right-handed parallel beta-helix repeat-containing protein [Chiayiivirga flava]MBB5208963.1 putative outer membrane repeat protein [Chiayiivirga flava]
MTGRRFALCLVLLVAARVQAADFAATRFDDPLPDGCAPADCSLREAVIAAQSAPGTDRVLLPAGTFLLEYDEDLPLDNNNTGPLLIDTPMQIVGAGRTATTITAAINLPLVIGVSLEGPAATLELSDLTIADAAAASLFGPVFVGEVGTLDARRVGMRGNAGSAGAIFAAGRLTVADSVFEQNTATAGGTGAVVLAARGPLSITGTQFIDNTSTNGALVVANYLVEAPLGEIVLRNNVYRGNLASESAAALTVLVANGLNRIDVSDSVFEDNHTAASGGAAHFGYMDDALDTTRLEVTADGTRFSGNSADEACGALNLQSDLALNLIEQPTLTMDLARFDGNTADAFGGALCTAADTTITRTTFAGNTAASQGGAIVSTGPTLRIERSTLSDNESGSVGGAIFSFSALTLDHSTVHGNRAATGAGGVLVSGTDESTIRRSTIAGNTSGGVASSVRLASSVQFPATLRLSASILQGACTFSDPAAQPTSSYTIESPGNTCRLATSPGGFNQRNVSSADLALGALADNGGPTLTRMPGDDSVARDPGLSSGTPCSRVDQRGYVSVDTRCDAGSVEVAGIPAEPLPPDVFADGFE